MAQTFATLLFLLVAAAGAAVIAASLIGDWALMMRALGFGKATGFAPLPPRVHVVTQDRLAFPRFECLFDDLRVAA